MKKILLLEKKIDKLPAGYDLIFSFFPNADSQTPVDVIDIQTYRELYSQTFEILMSRIDSQAISTPSIFSYREVDLLQCFKKKLFNSCFDRLLRYQLLEKLVGTDESVFFELGELPQATKENLIFLIRNSRLDKKVAVSDSGSGIEPLKSQAKRHFPRYENYWPRHISFGCKKKSAVVVYSDFSKSAAILEKLKLESQAPVFYTDVQSPGVFLKCFKKSIGYCQKAFNSKQKNKNNRVIEALIDSARTTKIFQGETLSGLDMNVFFKFDLENIFRKMLPKLLHDIDSMVLFFDQNRNVKAALLDEDIAPSKNAFVQIAKKRKISSYVEVHAALGEKTGFAPVTADYLFVWGEAHRERMVKWGCESDRIIVSGCSRYLAYQNQDAAISRSKICRELNLCLEKPIVLVAFPPLSRSRFRFFENSWVRYFQEALSALSGFKNLQIIFKFKARANDEFRQIAEEWAAALPQDAVVRYVSELPSLEVINASDFVITFGSTFAIEGLALGKPVILLHASQSPLFDELERFRPFLYADGVEEIKEAIHKILAGAGTLDAAKRNDVFSYYLGNGAESPTDIIVYSMLKHARVSNV
ncbi:MAG TPA: UDP-N-acetylglucosamine 2-epimerase [Candidatus Omnitrophota bacterium]|nr:UDP-N-acetylglucosamine 2-epimerase [Candidatus Omnitrophota bacterium]